MNKHIWIPLPTKLDQIRIFGRKYVVKNSGKGLRQYGINYACNASREAFMRNYRDALEISICDHDIGWAAIKIDNTWNLAQAIQPGFDGVNLKEWLRISRELRQKNKDEVEHSSASVERALKRIHEIDQRASVRARVRPKAMTLAQEREYYQSQFIGLSVAIPEDLSDLVRNDDGLLGTKIEGDDPAEEAIPNSEIGYPETERHSVLKPMSKTTASKKPAMIAEQPKLRKPSKKNWRFDNE